MARSDPKNSTEYWWDRHLTGLSLMRADFTTHEYPPHIHEALVVAVTENGGSVVKSRGQVEAATPSTLFVFNPAEPHAGAPQPYIESPPGGFQLPRASASARYRLASCWS